jgi:flavin-binding protein dodecin
VARTNSSRAVPAVFAGSRLQSQFEIEGQILPVMAQRHFLNLRRIFRMDKRAQEVVGFELFARITEQQRQTRRAPHHVHRHVQLPQAVLRSVDRALVSALRQVERVFDDLLLVNVVNRSGHHDRTAVAVALRRAAHAEPAIVAAAGLQARLHVVGRALLQVIAQRVQVRLAVIAMHQLVERGDARFKLAFPIAEQRVETG